MNEDTKENQDKCETIANKPMPFGKALPVGCEAENIMKWAALMAETRFYQDMVTTGGKNAILAIFLTARSLDVDPMLAINGGISCVKGRAMLSSALMNMLIRRQGHSIKKKVGTDVECRLIGRRRDNGDEMESVFTWEMAERAGLTKNPVYKSYPERMLFNRALSNLAKDLFPDCIGNTLLEGELDNVSPAEGAVVADEPRTLEEASKFVEDNELYDASSPASVFVDYIAMRTGDTRRDTIINAAKNPERFLEKLREFRSRNNKNNQS